MSFTLFLEFVFFVSQQVLIGKAHPDDEFCYNTGFVNWIAYGWGIGCVGAIVFYEIALILHFLLDSYYTVVIMEHYELGKEDPELQMKEKKRIDELEKLA